MKILGELQEIFAQRNPPENLNPKDEKLFSKSYKASFYVQPIIQLENVAVLQDTIFDPLKLFFYASYTHTSSLSKLPIYKRIVQCALKKWRTIPHGIWIKDEWSANYFHWMTDCLPRLWIGLQSGVSDRVILPDSYSHLSYVIESLDILKIRPTYYQSNENLWVENLILPPRTATFPNFNEEYTKQTRENLSLKTSLPPTKKIYASRKFATKRKAHNETEVELLMVKKGYEIVYMERLSLREQIRLMSETKILVSLHGAALANMLFMQAEQTVVELRNMGDSKTQCYYNLAATLGQKYFYTINKADGKDSITSDFTIDLPALKKVIDQLES